MLVYRSVQYKSLQTQTSIILRVPAKMMHCAIPLMNGSPFPALPKSLNWNKFCLSIFPKRVLLDRQREFERFTSKNTSWYPSLIRSAHSFSWHDYSLDMSLKKPTKTHIPMVFIYGHNQLLWRQGLNGKPAVWVCKSIHLINLDVSIYAKHQMLSMIPIGLMGWFTKHVQSECGYQYISIFIY